MGGGRGRSPALSGALRAPDDGVVAEHHRHDEVPHTRTTFLSQRETNPRGNYRRNDDSCLWYSLDTFEVGQLELMGEQIN